MWKLRLLIILIIVLSVYSFFKPKIDLYAMAFSLENPDFSIDVSDQVEVHQSDSGVLQSSGNSLSSSGEATRHGRMSSFSFDHHTFCSKCRGSDCDFDNKCDECMSWTKEEMEAYIELCKSLASKGKRSVAKPASSPRSIAPFCEF